MLHPCPGIFAVFIVIREFAASSKKNSSNLTTALFFKSYASVYTDTNGLNYLLGNAQCFLK